MNKIIYRFSLKVIAAALVLMVLLMSSGWSIDGKGYQNITEDQFVKMLEHKDFILINVHIPYEGEIVKTDLLIPFNKINLHQNELPKDKDAKIVVYCMMGPMGYIAAEKLIRMGYTSVVHFQGGMKAWKQLGKKLLFRSN
jgi:rhodanese-related sulfurtransferase